MTSGLGIGKAPKWRQLVSKLSCSERVRADIQSVALFQVSYQSYEQDLRGQPALFSR